VTQRTITRQFLRALSDTIPNGILVVDKHGQILVLNKVFSEILGVTEEEVLDHNIHMVVPKCQLPSVIETGRPSVKNVYKLKDRLFAADYYPLVSEGEVLGGVAVFVDITKSAAVESELKEVSLELKEITAYKKILEAVLQNAYEGIVIVDPDGRIIMFNGAYADFLGIRPEDAIGRHVTEIIENTRMHEVVKTGKAEIGQLQKIGKHNAVVMRIPIKIDNQVVAGVGKIWFKDLRDMENLFNRLNSLEEELAYYKEELRRTQEDKYSLDNLVGESKVMLELKRLIHKAAQTSSTVLITGESGTGKELVARAIHNLSSRRQNTFVRINCAAIPENILESELFGYAEGAFTGAKKGGKAGKFELAHKGSIFLDEIGDMSFHMPAKLLRFLKEKEFERLGENKTRQVNVRVIAATNQDLLRKIEKGEFREDLYYRLQVMNLEVPPLRERKEDIPLLLDYFINKFNTELGKNIRKADEQTLAALCRYDWPGNVRQLENVIERAYNLADGDTLTLDTLPIYLSKSYPFNRSGNGTGVSLHQAKDEMEKASIENALRQAGGNKSRAAQLLGITRTSLYQKIKKYNLK